MGSNVPKRFPSMINKQYLIASIAFVAILLVNFIKPNTVLIELAGVVMASYLWVLFCHMSLQITREHSRFKTMFFVYAGIGCAFLTGAAILVQQYAYPNTTASTRMLFALGFALILTIVGTAGMKFVKPVGNEILVQIFRLGLRLRGEQEKEIYRPEFDFWGDP